MLAYTFPDFIPGYAADGINRLPFAELLSRPIENAQRYGQQLYREQFQVSRGRRGVAQAAHPASALVATCLIASRAAISPTPAARYRIGRRAGAPVRLHTGALGTGRP